MHKPFANVNRKFQQAGLACLLLVLMLGANAAADPVADPARFQRIGHKMMCTCGCGQILLECNHVGCTESSREIGELHTQVANTGNTTPDSTVENWFVSKYGATVLAAPLRGGFDNVAWIVPISIFLLATLGTAWLVRAWTGRRHQLAPAGALPFHAPDDDLRARIRRETEY